MSIGEVLGLISSYCGHWDNYLTIMKNVYDIEVFDDRVILHFVDGNTSDVEIKKCDYLKETE